MIEGRILIIKLGAIGDVLRTTTVLREIDGEIIWVTKEESFPLLSKNQKIKTLTTLSAFLSGHERFEEFDLVLSLDDEVDACRMASSVKSKRLVGAYLEGGSRIYSESSAGWFDMGLISRFGLDRANDLKRANTKTFQELLFEMLGLEFKGQKYDFFLQKDDHKKNAGQLRVGIETRAGDRWPMKQWSRYEELPLGLDNSKFGFTFFEQRPTLDAYIRDIAECDLIITGDTLCMHLGIALEKRVVALFGPTSADEIYDYGIVTKIASPIECIKCYRSSCDKKPDCMDRISADVVRDAVARNMPLFARVGEV